MSIGKAYYLHVKHATKDEWKTTGPNVTYWGWWQSKSLVEAFEKFFQSLGLETKTEETEMEFDDR